MRRIGLSLLFATVLAANPAFGQQASRFQRTVIASGPAAPQVQFQSKNEVQPKNGVPAKSEDTFSGPATALPRVYETPISGESVSTLSTPAPVVPADTPLVKLTFPLPNEVPTDGVERFLPMQYTVPYTTPSAIPAPASAQAMRPVAQNAVIQHHQLRLAPQVFEKNLAEKLGSRFIPVRNASEIAGLSRYNLPGRDGTNIELVVHQQNGIVSVTGSPRMVESTLQIVRFLDTADIPGGAVTRFLPVQQSNVESARRMADIMNRESMRVAQIDRPNVTVLPVGDAAVPGDPSLGRVLGSPNIDVIQDLNTIVIQGTPNDVAVIQAMIRQMEMLSMENEPIIELVPMLHTDSLRVSQLVQTLYAQVNLNRLGAITLYPLVKPNTILVIGRKESIEAAKDLMMKLDTPVDPNAQFQIFRLKHASAQELGPQVTNSFSSRPGNNVGLAPQVTSIVPDLRTNSLIVHANPRDMQEIASMIKQMDVPGSEITSFMKYFQLKNAMATEMATTIANAFGTASTTGRGAMLSVQGAGGVDANGNPVRASVMYNVGVSPDTRSNTLIVTAPPETMPLIEALIYQLDQLPAAESKVKIFHLVNGDASTLTTVLTNTFAAGATNQVATTRPGIEDGESTLVGARFQADIRTNSIIAIGSEGDLVTVEAMLIRLDSENLNNRKVFTIRLVNAPAEEIAPILNTHFNNEQTFVTQSAGTFLPLSPQEQYLMRTTVQAEPATNSLIVSTTPQYYEQIRQIIASIDERPQMVAIDVLIAEVTLGNSTDRGVEFALQDSILFNSTPGSTGTGLLNGTVPFISTSTGTVGTQGITNLGVPNTGGFSFAASSESVSMFIRALEKRNKTQILSRPQLKTLHNMRATIQIGERIPYAGNMTSNVSGPTYSTSWEETGTILDITPRIMPDGMVAIAVYIERSAPGTPIDIGGGTTVPQINTTNASTTLNAMDGQTIIFAGLISETKISNNYSVPGLNKIPVVKHLFEYDFKECKRTELLIMMTPRIIRTAEDMEMLNRQERERMSWCVSDVVRITGDGSIRRRSDEWYPSEVRHTYGTPIKLQETQLPPESPMLAPIPVLPVETK